MSNNNNDIWSILLVVGLFVFIVYHYNKKPEETEDYKKGYTAGQVAGYQSGVMAGQKNICRQVEDLSTKIFRTMQDEEICPQ